MNIAGIIDKVCVYAVPLVLALTVHEVAHGYVAKKHGDNTAKLAGRLTLNPLSHIDPIGTVALPLLFLSSGLPFIFGWARPVPINPYQFKDYRKGLRWVAASGPLSNLLMMMIWAFLYVSTFYLQQKYTSYDLVAFICNMALAGVSINAVLCVFNLIPIPPLDGSRIVNSYLSREASHQYMQLEPYGFFIITGLLLLGAFNVIKPVIAWMVSGSINLFDQIFLVLM